MDKNTKYETTMQRLYATLPMFQHIGPPAYKNTLENIALLCHTLDNPHKKINTIHIAGTNGKGSSAHMIAGILQCAGYTTGLYTSPHLKRFTERIKINGKEIPKASVVSFMERISPTLKNTQPSFFELTVAMALDYFARKKVDLCVVETGLGGRLDATNIVSPVVSLITHIGYDHQELLGHTLTEIAQEKAGIIKPGIKTIIGETQPAIRDVFIKKGKACNANIAFAKDEYRISEKENIHPYTLCVYRKNDFLYGLTPGLTGQCQKKNTLGVLSLIDELRRQQYAIPDKAIKRGIAEVTHLTGLKGRWQKLDDAPKVYCDVAHNQDGIGEVLKEIEALHYQSLYIILGIVKDKKASSILSLLPRHAHYYFCQAHLPRSLPAKTLQMQARSFALQGKVIEDVNNALYQARCLATPDDLIVITGSTFIVAELNVL